MDNLLIKLAEQVPALAVLVWLVFQFIGAQKQTNQQVGEIANKFSNTLLETEQKRNEVLTHMGDDCHAVQKRSIEVMAEVKTVLHENTAILRQVNDKLKDERSY